MTISVGRWFNVLKYSIVCKQQIQPVRGPGTGLFLFFQPQFPGSLISYLRKI
jgi:hypothetical protein